MTRPPLQPLVPPPWPPLNAGERADVRLGPVGSRRRTVETWLTAAGAAACWLFAGLMLPLFWASRNDIEGMASFSALSMWATAFACGVGVLAYLCFSVVPPRLRLVTGIVGGAVFGLQPVAALALMVLANSAA